VLVGLFFIAIVVFGILATIWVTWQKFHKRAVPSALVAAAFLALPYAHYAYSRADVSHLAKSIFPLLIGCLVLLATKPARIKWPLALVLCGSSLLVMVHFHPAWQCRANKQCVNIVISDTEVSVDARTASEIALLKKLVAKHAPDGQSFITTPFWPGAYPLFERKSPMWEIYALFSRSESFQQLEIERIKVANPGFILIFDFPLDGREELRFRNTHALIHRYILDNFEMLPDSPNLAYQIYTVKKTTPLEHSGFR
jgi:TRAP-type C4-dicarboxylate transport system permease small subunit